MNLLDIARAQVPAGLATRPAIIATPEQATDLRALLAVATSDWPSDERADALAAALADPDGALRSFRALVAERSAVVARDRPSDMRPCRACANLSAGGRCLAAGRGESLGDGIAYSRTWTPSMPDRPQRCGAYAPGPADPDRRSGRERWPFLFDRKSR